MNFRTLALCASLATAGAAGSALAQDQAPAAATGAAAAAPAAPMPAALTSPSITGPLSANPNPLNFDAGPFGKVYVGGAATGIALGQTHRLPGDNSANADIGNAMVWAEKTDGVFQFYIQAGVYSLPSLGAPYIKALTMTDSSYNVIPVAYVKLQPTPEFSVMAGKLPTLIGAEYTWTFQNPNIIRGLLWNQEPVVSRGVQANYAKGPLTVSVAWTDGYYSAKYSSGSALISYAFNSSNTLAVVGSKNFSQSTTAAFATPPLLNNGEIYNVIFTHVMGPLTLIPYFQYSHTPAIPRYGVTHDGSTTGVALLAKYQASPELSFGARAEYISTSDGGGVTNLLYGPGSNAWSLTLTPTWQHNSFFIRGEASYLKAGSITPGLGFGSSGLDTDQFRVMGETGFLF